MTLRTLENEIRVYNWFYRLGSPLISDEKYAELYSRLRAENPNSPLVTSTWSDMERPTDALIEWGMNDTAIKLEKERAEVYHGNPFFMPEINMKYRDMYWRENLEYFMSEVSKSIDTIESENDSADWLSIIQGALTEQESLVMNVSIKADGFNLNVDYVNPDGGEFSYFIGARTRGRTGEPDDVTIALSKVVPLVIRSPLKFTRVVVEGCMDKDSLPELRVLDPSRDWKTTRNSMSSLLLNNIGDEFHKRIIPVALKVSGLRFESKELEFDWLTEQGFTVVYNVNFSIKTHSDLLNAVKEISDGNYIYKGDGVVVTVNDTHIYEEFDTSGKYDFCQRAYRLDSWRSGIYISIVTGFDQNNYYNSKKISMGAIIKPTTVANGATIRYLDVDNPSRVEYADLDIGSLIVFWMRSDSCVDWLVGPTIQLNNLINSGNKEISPALLVPLQKLQKSLQDNSDVIL